MANIFIGTSGYSYKDWVGIFYPRGIRPSEYLAYYARYFSFTELNFSYYRQPETKAVENMVNQTPENFRFSIKGHKTLTHERTGDLKTEAEHFQEGIRPLQESGKLTAVLLQFPYSFHYTQDNRNYLGNLCDCCKNLPLALEFRNKEWQKPSVYNELRNRNMIYVIVDMPILNNLPVPEVASTSETGYIRFHGRNSKNWWNGTSTTRYDYLYSKNELFEWIEKLSFLIKETKILLIAFNNHYKGKAVENALDLKKLLIQKNYSVGSGK